MDHKSKRRTIVSIVLASSVIVSIICAVVLSNAISGQSVNPNITPTPTNTTAPITTTPKITDGNTAKPSITPEYDPSAPGYDENEYDTPNNNKTPSRPTETPIPTTAPPYEDANLINSSIKLVSFNTKDRIAAYEVTLTFNKSGNVTLIAVDSGGNYTENNFKPSIMRQISNYYSLLSNGEKSKDIRMVTANVPMTFTIEVSLTSNAATSRFDLFWILDESADLQMQNTKALWGKGGIPEISSKDVNIYYNEENGSIDFSVNTTLNTSVVVYIRDNNNSLINTVTETASRKNDIYTADFQIKVPDGESYNGYSVEVILQYNNVKDDSGVRVIGTITMPDEVIPQTPGP